MESHKGDVTCLLHAWQDGNEHAMAELMPLVYEQLRRSAARYLHQENSGHTLQATALVHEVYLRLAGSETQTFTDRAHFFALAARMMRHILLDWAKGRTRDKRGGGSVRETFDSDLLVTIEHPETIVEVDRLLQRMSAFDTRKVQVVEMIFFAGMTYDEVAAALGITAVTVHRDLKMAKAWMRSELSKPPERAKA